MRIRLVIRWRRRKTRHPNIAQMIARFPCLMGHHQSRIELRDKAMVLRCERCGWTSPGWHVGAGT